MNRFLKVLGVLVVIIGLGAGAAFYFTSGMVKRADEFLLAAKSGDLESAYDFFSRQARSDASKAGLQEMMRSEEITGFSKSSWSNRSINNDRGKLVGTITTESGMVVPLEMEMIKEDDQWMVFAIIRAASGVQSAAADSDIPPQAVLQGLVSESMLIFAQSANERSMARFHAHISQLWRDQFTVERLDEAYGTFFETGDLTVLQQVTPVFSEPPRINERGALTLIGYYPTRPSQVNFDVAYIREGEAWKLVSFGANISAAEETPAEG